MDQDKAELSRELIHEYVPLLVQQKRDWVYRSMELMYIYAKQHRYAKLAESPLLPLALPSDPGHEDLNKLLANLNTHNVKLNEQIGRAPSEMTVAYTIYRNDQEPIFQQLEESGHALVAIPLPEKNSLLQCQDEGSQIVPQAFSW